jgi:hypothetical protein
MRPSRGCAPSRFFEKGPSRTSASRDLFKRQIAGTVIRMGSSVARTLLSANPGSTHPQPSPQPRVILSAAEPSAKRMARRSRRTPIPSRSLASEGPQLSLPGVRPFSRSSRRGHHEPEHQGICSSGRSLELSSEWFKCGADTPVREPRQHPPATIPKAPSS